MKEERTTPQRARMIEDMRIRGMGDRAQEARIRTIKDFAGFLRRSPDLATPNDLCAYQLHMTNAGVSPWMFDSRIVALRFFFGVTCVSIGIESGPPIGVQKDHPVKGTAVSARPGGAGRSCNPVGYA